MAANLSIELPSPTTPTPGAGDYKVLSTSEKWGQLCSWLPTSGLLQWPGYESSIPQDLVVGGETFTIQCWRGDCQQLLRGVKLGPLFAFPGGVGAEVGVYWKHSPYTLPFPHREEALRPEFVSELGRELRALWEASIDWANGVRALAEAGEGVKIWWPALKQAPKLPGRVAFKLYHPEWTSEPFVSTSGKTYWTNAWMEPESTTDWLIRRGIAPAPLVESRRYELRFRVAGHRYVWPADEPTIHRD